MIIVKAADLFGNEDGKFIISDLTAGDLRLFATIGRKAQPMVGGFQSSMIGRFSFILERAAEGQHLGTRYISGTADAERMFIREDTRQTPQAAEMRMQHGEARLAVLTCYCGYKARDANDLSEHVTAMIRAGE